MRNIVGKKMQKAGFGIESNDMVGDVIYPSFYIDIKHLPEAKTWEIGKEYTVTLKLRQTGLNLRRNEGRKEDYGNADFEIVGIDPHGPVEKEKTKYSRVKKE